MSNKDNYKVKFLKCLICNDEKEYGRLHKHLFSVHGVSSQQYTIKYLYNSIEPTCKCGCGYKTRYVQFSFKEFHKGHNANRKGIKLPEEQIKKMSEIGKKRAQEEPEKFIELMNNARKYAYTKEANKKRADSVWSSPTIHENHTKALKQRYIDHPELKEQIGERMKQWHASLTEQDKEKRYNSDWKDKISESITNKYLEGGFEWSRGTYFSTKMKENFYYRSSWELRYMKQLDQDNSVIAWIYEPFWISYFKNEEAHRYIPDFIIEYNDAHKEIHEVGVKTLKEEFFIEKIEAIKDFCNKNNYLFKIIEF